MNFNFLKNGIGRPSNEIIKKRRIFYISCGLFTAFILICGILFFGDRTGLLTSISSNTKLYQVYSTNSTIIQNNKKYKKNKPITVSGPNSSVNVSGKQIITSGDGSTKIMVKGTFGSNYLPTEEKKNFFSKKKTVIHYNFSVEAYDQSGKKLYFKSSDVTSNKIYLGSITITKKTAYLMIRLKNYSSSIAMVTVVNIAATPTVNLVDNSGTKETNGVHRVKNIKTYTPTVKVPSNTTNRYKYYYKVFIFNSHSTSYKNVVSETSCHVHNDSKKINVPVGITRKKTSAVARLYTTKELCISDTTKVGNNYGKKDLKKNTDSKKYFVSSDSVKYKLEDVYKNSSGIKYINYDIEELGVKIGSQTTSTCPHYASAYAHYILTGGKTNTALLPGNGQTSQDIDLYYGTTRGSTSLQNLYSIVSTNIDKGFPVVLHFSTGGDDTHWMLAIGYNTNVSWKQIKGQSDFKANVYVLDPYSSKGYGVKSKDVLSVYRLNDNKAWFRAKDLTGSYRYWKNLQAAFDAKITLK